ncbi:PDR/VanB family oxidoreductase [Ottowia sp. VDI28]|uniref:PDR/VanB family oxidoreductase n=1 Tax=Ottowia sp. VDI28 TaxID=3133968 RepID=UPI003C3063A5
MSLLNVRVARRWREAEGIDAFEITPVDASVTLPAYQAGAHIDVHLPNGMVRQYSLCGQPEASGAQGNRYRIAVLREEAGRGGSRYLHEQVFEGQVLSIGLPRHAFGLQADSAPSVLLAGGVGITPLLAMAYELAARGCEFHMHLFARSRARAPFQSELASERLAGRVTLHFDDEALPGQPPALATVLSKADANARAYVCGPAGFLDCAREEWAARGRPEERFHFESFVPVAPAADAGTFEVEVASTGQVVTVAADETVVAALARCGVEVPLSCEQGICGTCLTGVREGIPEHHDMYLSDDERARNDCFTPCCSRAKSARLVLAL